MKSRKPQIAVLMLALLVGRAVASPEIPGAAQKRPIAIVGGVVHTVSGPAIDDGVVLFQEGKITAVGARGEVKIPKDAKQIDAAGKHVYPGLFDAATSLGLIEIDAVRATLDYAEVGRINPNVRANVAVNPDSELIPVTRSNGVLLAVTAPTGGLISGRSAVLQLDGWTYEDMTLRADVGMHVEWPGMAAVVNSSTDKSGEERAKRRDEALAELRRAFDDARAYQQARSSNAQAHPLDARWEAMLPVLAGAVPLVVKADEAQQIQSAVAFAASQKVRLIILGGYDAPHCATLLKKHDVPVIVSAVYRLPSRRDDDYDAAYTLPVRLREAGVKFCISGAGHFVASNVRNLPYHAATAAAYGLAADEALKAITLYPAEMLGVADRVGSLQSGKDATLFIADGDILETATHVENAFTQGRAVDLSNRHTRLYEKYREKYRRLGDAD